jgi:hypothetical protein
MLLLVAYVLLIKYKIYSYAVYTLESKLKGLFMFSIKYIPSCNREGCACETSENKLPVNLSHAAYKFHYKLK